MNREKYEFVMIRIPAGSFIMGSRVGHGDQDEFPAHEVYLDEFLIGRYPVTASEWAVFLNDAGRDYQAYFEPSGETTVFSVHNEFLPRRGCDLHPANGMTWYGAVAYCQWLSEKAKREYRLPFEAEWEKACRGGMNQMRYPWGNELPAGRAQFFQKWSNPGHTLSPVNAYKPNGYGLFDLVGNVWEWCQDWYGYDYYQHAPDSNPHGAEGGEMKVMRGGSWGCLDVQVRCGIRVGEWPDSKSSGIGFRLARWP